MKAQNPSFGVGDVSRELGKRWEVCPERARYEAMAVKDKERYDRVHALLCLDPLLPVKGCDVSWKFAV